MTTTPSVSPASGTPTAPPAPPRAATRESWLSWLFFEDDPTLKAQRSKALLEAKAKNDQATIDKINSEPLAKRFSIRNTFNTLAVGGLLAVGADYIVTGGMFTQAFIAVVTNYLNFTEGQSSGSIIKGALNYVFNPLAQGFDELASATGQYLGLSPEDAKVALYPLAMGTTWWMMHKIVENTGIINADSRPALANVASLAMTAFAISQIGQRSDFQNWSGNSFMMEPYAQLENKWNLLPTIPQWPI